MGIVFCHKLHIYQPGCYPRKLFWKAYWNNNNKKKREKMLWALYTAAFHSLTRSLFLTLLEDKGCLSKPPEAWKPVCLLAVITRATLNWMSIYLLVYKPANGLLIFTWLVSDRRIRTEISMWLFPTPKRSKFLHLSNVFYISDIGNSYRAHLFFHPFLYPLLSFLNSSQHSSLICSAFNYPHYTQSHLCSRRVSHTQLREEEIDDISVLSEFQTTFCMHRVFTVK